MKKICLILIVSLLMLIIVEKPIKVSAQENVELTEDCKSACLIECQTGQIIYSKNENEKLAPASMTKIMTMILVMDKVKKGIIKLTDVVKTPKEASELGGSQIYLSEGEEMTVNDLIKSMTIASANDATMSLAIHVGGSERTFVKMMNDKVKELGLKNTNFVNPYGFDHNDHYSSAYDMAIMSQHLINNYPEILQYTSVYEDYVREDSVKKFWLVNTNKLVRFVNEVDGLKTGYTTKSGYCLSATINKNNERFIAVAMGNSTSTIRNNEIMSMLNYGVNNYSTKKIIAKDEVIKEIDDKGYTPNKIILKAEKDIIILQNKGNNNDNINIVEEIDLNNGSKLKVYVNNELFEEINLISEVQYKKATVFEIILEVMKEIFLVTE